MKAITDDTIRQIHYNLKDFGYTVTYGDVKAEVELIAAGSEPKGIIGMFARDMLKKNGYLEKNYGSL